MKPQELQERKHRLADELSRLFGDFTEETGLFVESVDVESVETTMLTDYIKGKTFLIYGRVSIRAVLP